MAKKYYTVSATQDFIDSLLSANYEILETGNESLGIDCIALAPSKHMYNYEITEIYQNCWSSVERIRRFDKTSKRLQEKINKAYDYMEQNQ